MYAPVPIFTHHRNSTFECGCSELLKKHFPTWTDNTLHTVARAVFSGGR